MRRAAEAGSVEAEVTLGDVYAQVSMLPNAATECARWYRLAAEKGHPVAQDRLADLHLRGYGVRGDDGEAFGWYARTAAQAYPHALCNLAYMLGEGLGKPADSGAAAVSYLSAAALADPRGLFNLGLLYSEQKDDPAFAAAAHACLTLAAFAQYPLADEHLQELNRRRDADDTTATAVELASRLRERLRAFQTRLRSDPGLAERPDFLLRFAYDNLAQLGHPAFSPDRVRDRQFSTLAHSVGKRETVSADPRIFTIDDFLSETERAHLLALAASHLAPSREATRERLSGEQDAFSGQVAIIRETECDAVIRNIERRIGAAFELPASHVEPLSILRYAPGASYAAHVDYFDSARLANNFENGDLSGQRIASFLVYLHAPGRGGETDYTGINRKVAGRARMALFHFNCLPSGATDPRTLHTGREVITGEKWLMRTTLREKPLYRSSPD